MKKIVFLLFFQILSACSSKDTPPDNVIEEGKMIQMLADIHIIEAKVSKIGLLSIDSSTLVAEHLKLQLYKRNQIDSATFNRSFKFYTTHPKVVERVYGSIIKELEKREKKKDYHGI